MRKLNNRIRLYIVCWGVLSIIGGSCLITVSLLGDKAGVSAVFLFCACIASMLGLLWIAIREADDTGNWKSIRLPVKKTARIGRGAPLNGESWIKG
jgi:uncharacterized membrane protein